MWYFLLSESALAGSTSTVYVFLKTETETKTFSSRPRPRPGTQQFFVARARLRLFIPRPRPRPYCTRPRPIPTRCFIMGSCYHYCCCSNYENLFSAVLKLILSWLRYAWVHYSWCSAYSDRNKHNTKTVECSPIGHTCKNCAQLFEISI